MLADTPKLFASLRTALMVWCAVAGAWALYTMFLTSSERQLESRWAEAWWNSAVWHMLYAALLLVIAYLWRPSRGSLRYAFAHEVRPHERQEGWDDADGNIELEYGPVGTADDDDDLDRGDLAGGVVLDVLDEADRQALAPKTA